MRTVFKIFIWLVIFVVVFVLRFPYHAVFVKLVEHAETATEASLTWDKADVGLMGADISGLNVSTSSGFSFSADKVHIHPSLSGLKADLTQGPKGKGTAAFHKNELHFTCEEINVDTGSQELQTVTMNADITYSLSQSKGEGTVNLKIPELADVLPVKLTNLEIASKIHFKEDSKTNVSTTDNDITLYGEGFTGEGKATITANGSDSPDLKGQLNVKTKQFGNHKISLGGTWARPEFKLAGAQE